MKSFDMNNCKAMLNRFYALNDIAQRQLNNNYFFISTVTEGIFTDGENRLALAIMEHALCKMERRAA